MTLIIVLWCVQTVSISVNGLDLPHLLHDPILWVDGIARRIYQGTGYGVAAVEVNMLQILVSFIDVFLNYIVGRPCHDGLIGHGLQGMLIADMIIFHKDPRAAAPMVLVNNEGRLVAWLLVTRHLLRHLFLHRQIKSEILTAFTFVAYRHSRKWLSMLPTAPIYMTRTLLLLNSLKLHLHFQNLLTLLLLVVLDVSIDDLLGNVCKGTDLDLGIYLV